MLFWYFGHPLVYFWIMGAYIIWYTVVPATFGGRIFSDALTRLAFILLLLFSTPVGIHHQFVDPGISAGWKWLHMLLTYGVVIPSFMTAFAIFATFELAARRAGVRGFWKTIRFLPWKDPVFAGPAFAMLLFIPGGFGGIVNASYSMDVLVHNTMWIVGHFHITVGGPVALTFMGAAYGLVPALTGRKLFAPKVALAQVWMWFVGMTIMSLSMHWAGLLGAPRRTSDVSYLGAAGAQAWHPEMVAAAIGGTLLFVSIVMFVYVAVGTRLQNTQRRRRAAVSFRAASTKTRWRLRASSTGSVRGPPSPSLSRYWPTQVRSRSNSRTRTSSLRACARGSAHPERPSESPMSHLQRRVTIACPLAQAAMRLRHFFAECGSPDGEFAKLRFRSTCASPECRTADAAASGRRDRSRAPSARGYDAALSRRVGSRNAGAVSALRRRTVRRGRRLRSVRPDPRGRLHPAARSYRQRLRRCRRQPHRRSDGADLLDRIKAFAEREYTTR